MLSQSLIRRWTRVFFVACVAVWTLGSPASAQAQQVYWKMGPLLKDFFPDADQVTYEKVHLKKAELAALHHRLGYVPSRKAWTIFIAIKDDQVAGYAVFDEEKGAHEPITFAVKLSPEAVIERLELVAYREAYGGEVSSKAFRKQFRGKTWQDKLALGKDISAVSGATISSRSLSVGSKRASAVVALLLERDRLDEVDAKTETTGHASKSKPKKD